MLLRVVIEINLDDKGYLLRKISFDENRKPIWIFNLSKTKYKILKWII